MWEDVLVVGITPSLKRGKRPFLWIHGRNEEGEKRSQTCFANNIERETEDGEKEKLHYFSGNLQLALGATQEKLEDTYNQFIATVRERDTKAAQVLRNKLHDATAKGASIFSAVEDAMAANDLEEARGNAATVVESLTNMLVGRVLRLDWDDALEFPSLARHVCPIRRSLQDQGEVFGGKEISEWLQEFESGSPKSFEDSMEDAFAAFEDDQEYESEVQEARAQKSTPAKKPTAPASKKKTTAAKKQTVPQDADDADSDEVPF